MLDFAHRLDVRLGLLAAMLSIVLVVVLRRRLIAERTARVLGGGNISFATTEERVGMKREAR